VSARTPEQHAAATAAMSAAMMAGLPPNAMAVLLVFRRLWWAEHEGTEPAAERPAYAVGHPFPPPEEMLGAELEAALKHPAALVWDEVFVRAMRHRLGLR